jgi:hypothetical protein
MPMPDSDVIPMRAQLAAMYKQFGEPRSYCSRLFACAWIEEQAIPDVRVESTGFHFGKPVHQAYVEQTSLGWNLCSEDSGHVLASSTGIRIFSEQSSPGYRDNGESWSGQAQAWMFDLFDFVGDAQ